MLGVHEFVRNDVGSVYSGASSCVDLSRPSRELTPIGDSCVHHEDCDLSEIIDHYYRVRLCRKGPNFVLRTDQHAHETSGQYSAEATDQYARHEATDQYTDEGDLLDVSPGRCSWLKPSPLFPEDRGTKLLLYIGSAVCFSLLLCAVPALPAVF